MHASVGIVSREICPQFGQVSSEVVISGVSEPTRGSARFRRMLPMACRAASSKSLPCRAHRLETETYSVSSWAARR